METAICVRDSKIAWWPSAYVEAGFSIRAGDDLQRARAGFAGRECGKARASDAAAAIPTREAPLEMTGRG
jgi:hypothetical protein